MKRFLFAVLLALSGLGSAADNVDSLLRFSARQALALYRSVKDLEGRLPRSADQNGGLTTSDDAYWCSGFTAGVLWYLYEYSGCDSLKTAAEVLTQRVERQQYTTGNHDVGFMINCSQGQAYRLTNRPEYRLAVINAARSLSTRFSSARGVIRSWDDPQWRWPVIIDNMMNLELLAVATRLSGDSSFLNIAVSHADTTLKYHFRPDGSCCHVVDYGNSFCQQTHQGYSHGSAWARGQAWALYGYTMMFRETRKSDYLRQAIRIADFIIDHPRLPVDRIPYWDFDAPDIPRALRDASAGAIICSALLELSTFTEKSRSDRYLAVARRQLETLSSPEYRAEGVNCNGNFILRHGVGHFPNNSEVDAPLTYADYYFVEALMRYRNLYGNNKLN